MGGGAPFVSPGSWCRKRTGREAGTWILVPTWPCMTSDLHSRPLSNSVAGNSSHPHPCPSSSPKFPQAQTEYPSKLQTFLGFLEGAVLHMTTRGHCHVQSWDVLSPSGSACLASPQSLLTRARGTLLSPFWPYMLTSGSTGLGYQMSSVSWSFAKPDRVPWEVRLQSPGPHRWTS